MFVRESLAETNKESSKYPDHPHLEASVGGLDSQYISLGFPLNSEEWRRGPPLLHHLVPHLPSSQPFYPRFLMWQP